MGAVTCVCRDVFRTQSQYCLSTGWALNRCFAKVFGTAAVLVQGAQGGEEGTNLDISPTYSLEWSD